jgi:hypothetical protein
MVHPACKVLGDVAPPCLKGQLKKQQSFDEFAVEKIAIFLGKL